MKSVSTAVRSLFAVSILATILVAQGAMATEQRERPRSGNVIKRVIAWLSDQLSTPPG